MPKMNLSHFEASILFAPTKPHPESGSVEHLKAVAARVYGKL